jgi:hypothetical protein
MKTELGVAVALFRVRGPILFPEQESRHAFFFQLFVDAGKVRSDVRPSKSAAKRHVHQLGETVRRYQHKEQALLIRALNLLIIGWSRYYSRS